MAMNSTMQPLGSPAPVFRLMDTVSGQPVGLADFEKAPAAVVMFICNHCPFVKHIRAELAKFGQDYAGRVAVFAINSNDVSRYPDDAPEKMAEAARAAGYTFPYLFDESQEVAKAYGAACTPDFFVYGPTEGARRRLVYRGQLDDSRPNSGVPVTGKDLRAAVEAVLAGKSPSADQKPSVGCGIKWKPGNEPG